MVKNYLNALKTKGNFTYSDISNLSGIPEATIRKIFSGETADPRFDTIVKLVVSMGGSLDEAISGKKEEELETNAIISLKEIYESRIEDVKFYIDSLKNDIKMLSISAIVLAAFIVLLIVIDISIGSHGWIQY